MTGNELNRLAIWLPMASDEINVKKYAEGYPYIKKGILHNSTIVKPVIRYAKNYIVQDKKLSLCIITNDSSISNVENWLDEQAKTIKLSDIKRPFTLLNVYYD